MNIRLILTLSTLGVAMGLGSLFGRFPRGTEGWLWLAIGIVCAVVIARAVQTRRFLHGFLVGLIAGLLSPLIQVLFFSVYLSNNAYAAESFERLPAGMSARLLVLVMAPVISLLNGLVAGLLAWLAGKLIGRRPRVSEGAR